MLLTTGIKLHKLARLIPPLCSNGPDLAILSGYEAVSCGVAGAPTKANGSAPGICIPHLASLERHANMSLAGLVT